MVKSEEAVSKKNKPVIVSTGMTNISDLEDIKKIFKKNNNNKFSFLKCTSSYPAKPKDSNLLATRFSGISFLF